MVDVKKIFPFFKVKRGGVKRGKMAKENFFRDKEAYRTVRDTLCEDLDIDWGKIGRKTRKSYFNFMRKDLLPYIIPMMEGRYLPKNRPRKLKKLNDSDFQMLARTISNSLASNNLTPQEALKFAKYLVSKNREIPEESRFIQAERERGAGARGQRRGGEIPERPPEGERPQPPEGRPERGGGEPPAPEGGRPPGGGRGENPCPNCMSLFQRSYPLEQVGDDLYYCNSCKVTFQRVRHGVGHKLIPMISEFCEECGKEKTKVSGPAPSGEGKIHSFFCPAHDITGPHQTLGLTGQLLSDYYYDEWVHFRGQQMTERLKYLEQHGLQYLADKYGPDLRVVNHPEKGWIITGKPAPGKKKEFYDSYSKLKRTFGAFEATAGKIGKVDTNIKKMGLGEHEKELEDELTQLVDDDSLVKRFDTKSFPEEEQKEHEETFSNAMKGILTKGEAQSKKKSAKEYEEKRMKRPFKFINRIADKTGHHVQTVIFSLFLIVIGVAIAAMTGIWQFIVSFACMAFYTLVPNPQQIKLIDKEESDRFTFGSLFATRENSYNTGFGATKQMMKILAIIFFGLGLHSTFFPLSNLILLLFVFGAYFSLPVEYDPLHPDQIIGSIGRVIVALYMGIYIFGAFGGGIFQSPVLGWLSIAFFLVLPVPTERENLIRAIGKGLGGTTANYENIDKILFLIIMLLIGGFTVFGAGGLGVTMFVGTGGVVFGVVWLIAFFTGIMTPASSRPYMGIMVLLIAFVIFGFGVGEQTIGTAFLGEWWPAVHNSVTDFMEPMGGLFEQFQNTFGQTWLLFTNPVGYAQQITSGQYTSSDRTAAAPVGLEIERFKAAGIYLGEPFSVRFELNNRGDFDARNVSFSLSSYIQGIQINPEPMTGEYSPSPMLHLGDKDKFKRKLYEYNIGKDEYPNFTEIIKKDIIPVNLLGSIGCFDVIHQRKLLGIDTLSTDKRESVDEMRKKYIPLTLKTVYDYHVDSTLQVDVISEEEWRRLSRDNALVRQQKPSLISPSPVKLSLGVMDQPIKEGEQVFLGFNLSTTENEDEMLEVESVRLEIPKSWAQKSSSMTCSREPKSNNVVGDYWVLEWEFKDTNAYQVFCYPKTPGIGDSPKKTFTFRASADYTLQTIKTEETLINFADSCENTRTWAGTYNVLFPGSGHPGGTEYCSWLMDNNNQNCSIGAGGCQSDSECEDREYQIEDDRYGKLICMETSSGVDACCPEGIEDAEEKCGEAHEIWIERGYAAEKDILAVFQS